MKSEFITIDEAVELVKKSKSTLQRMVKNGDLDSKMIKVGKRTKKGISLKSLSKYMSNGLSNGLSNDSLIEFLKDQLTGKDRQIEQLQQIIAMEKSEKMRLLEMSSFHPSNAEEVEPPKKGFFGRLFK